MLEDARQEKQEKKHKATNHQLHGRRPGDTGQEKQEKKIEYYKLNQNQMRKPNG